MFTKWLAYDLEACFLKKGCKRHETQILEIALYNKDISFQRLVNPLAKYASGVEVLDSLVDLNQHPDNTVQFWTKLLIGKKILSTAVKRKDVFEKAEAISKVLSRSTVARSHEDPELMVHALQRHDDDVEKAKDDLKKVDKAPALFYTPHEAISEALNVGAQHLWIAHNGTAFDSKILKGHDEHDWKSIRFHDSLPLLKKKLPDLASYSQPMVYHHLFKKKYFAHHALEDSKALYQILNHVIDDITDVVTKKKSSLLDLKGIGAKSVEFLHSKKITDKEQLIRIVSTLSLKQWCKEYSKIHQHKKFWKTYNNFTSSNTAVV